jgi:amino acid transporter
MILVQSVSQIIALFVLRKNQPHLKRPYAMWLYPVPAVIARVGSGTYLLWARTHRLS